MNDHQTVDQAYAKYLEIAGQYRQTTKQIEKIRQQYDAAWEKVNDAWEQEEANNV